MPVQNHAFRCATVVTRGVGRHAATLLVSAVTAALSPASLAQEYTLTNLGMPPGADTVSGVRMNNAGDIVGSSVYFGQLDSTRGWVWRQSGGFELLPTPPGMPFGRFAAKDISNTGIIAGDGGGDNGPAWRYENGAYTIIDLVPGTGSARLGGVNDAGDIAGTGKDGSITTADEAWVDLNGTGLVNLTPGSEGGRATDINNAGQVCGYTQGPLTGFEALLWDASGAVRRLGTMGLAASFAWAMNDRGDVVGQAKSASGSFSRAWIYSDALGQQLIPAPAGRHISAVAVNNLGHVVGWSDGSGPILGWVWTPTAGIRTMHELFDFVGAGVSAISPRDINDAGQILVKGFDGNAVEWRMFLLSPIELTCYADCDQSTGPGVLDIFDFLCFQNSFVAGEPYACDCDTTSGAGVCDIFDFLCFQTAFVGGCP